MPIFNLLCVVVSSTHWNEEYHEYKKSFEIKRIPKTPYTVKLNKNLHRGF